jgi:hypothetical protein
MVTVPLTSRTAFAFTFTPLLIIIAELTYKELLIKREPSTSSFVKGLLVPIPTEPVLTKRTTSLAPTLKKILLTFILILVKPELSELCVAKELKKPIDPKPLIELVKPPVLI